MCLPYTRQYHIKMRALMMDGIKIVRFYILPLTIKHKSV